MVFSAIGRFKIKDTDSLITTELLKYLNFNLDILKTIGINLKINSIRDQDLTNKQLLEIMKQKGILKLPALLM